MRRYLVGLMLGLLLAVGSGSAAFAEEPGSTGSTTGAMKRPPTRIDFDERLVQGQTKRAEALYLFERKDSEIRSMVFRRKSFRQEILRKLDE
jgi:hypothetical protein